MAKTPKKSDKKKILHSPQIIRIKLRRRGKNFKYKIQNTIYQNYISSAQNKKLSTSVQTHSIDPIINIKNIIILLSDFFTKDKVLHAKSLKDLHNVSQNANNSLFADFGKLLNPKDFYECFISYIKQGLSSNKIQNIFSSKIYGSYHLFFTTLKSQDIKVFLFNNNNVS